MLGSYFQSVKLKMKRKFANGNPNGFVKENILPEKSEKRLPTKTKNPTASLKLFMKVASLKRRPTTKMDSSMGFTNRTFLTVNSNWFTLLTKVRKSVSSLVMIQLDICY